MSAPAAPSRAKPETKCLVRPFEVKELDEAKRRFTGHAAAFSLDLGGDVILPGAFKRTLSDWKRAKAKRIIYLIDSHNYGSIRSVVGKLVDAEEDDAGLVETNEVLDGPDGDEVWRRVAGGFVNGMSIGYTPILTQNPTTEQQQQGIRRLLKEIRLEENSLVIWPMNPDARVDAVKSLLALAKDRDLTPAEVEELKELQSQIGALLAPSPGDPPAAVLGLAPDDPARLAMEDRVRSLTLRSLSTGHF